MSRSWRNVWLTLPCLLLAGVLLIGCSGKEDFGKPKKTGGNNQETGDDGKDDVADTLKPIKGTGVASLRGVVKLTGGEPDLDALTEDLLSKMKKIGSDGDKCLMGTPAEKSEYNWVVPDRK